MRICMNFARCEGCRRIAFVNRARRWSPRGTVEMGSPSPPGASVRCWPRVRRPRRVKVNRHPRHTRQLCPRPRGPPLGARGLPQRHLTHGLAGHTGARRAAKTETLDGETELCRESFEDIPARARAGPSRSASSRGGAALRRAPDGLGTRLSEAMCFILQRSSVHPGASGDPLRRFVVAATAGRPPDAGRDDRSPRDAGWGRQGRKAIVVPSVQRR
jgi:hypothetical protein